jgi:hypothetical protein
LSEIVRFYGSEFSDFLQPQAKQWSFTSNNFANFARFCCKNRAFSGFLHGNAAYKSIDLGGEMHGVKRLKLRRAYKRLIPKRIWPLIVLPKIYLELPTLNT